MGKKKGKQQKSKSAAKPKDDRTLPFLQEMFPNVEKDIVGIIFEQNEYDEEKTVQQLEELSLNDGTKPAPLYDESDLVGEFGNEFEQFASTLISSQPPATIPPPKDNKRFTPPKYTPFISTYDDLPNTSTFSYETTPKPKTPTKRMSPTYNSITPTHTSTTPSTTPKSFNTPNMPISFSTLSDSPPSISNFPQSKADSNQFLASMFPELDSTLVELVYEENGNDVGKTVESLLSIVFMNHSTNAVSSDDEGGGGEEEEEEVEREQMIAHAEEELSSEELDSFEELEEDEEINMDNYQIEIPTSPVTASNDATAASQSDFIIKLNLLAELFPDTPRTLLALELDELDCDLEKTIASCCRADPEYLRRLSGETASVIKVKEQKVKEEKVKEEKPKGPSANDSVLKPSWVGAGNSHSHLLNSAAKVKYVKPVTPATTPTKTSSKARGKGKGKGKAAATQTVASPRRRAMDLAAKLKLKQLREKFAFVDSDILESVFVQSGHKIQQTLLCLYDIYPHLREHTAAPTHARTAYAADAQQSPPGSPEQPLSRKRADSGAQSAEKPRKSKRKSTDLAPQKESEFVTVSYLRKKKDSSTPNKKFMDSDDIENAYQNYREQAIKNGEMRNLMFREAAAAYQSGDGARAKALSQRGRDYDEMMKESHRQACHQIFLDCNARLDTLASIDLHGLHVAEALQVINQLLEIHATMGQSNNKTRKLRVITGQGNHSIHGVAKIKPAVKNFLRSKGYTFVEAEAGVITIKLSKI